MLTGLSIREHLPQIEVAVADNATALVLRVLSAPSDGGSGAACGSSAPRTACACTCSRAGSDSVRRWSAPGEPLRYALPRFGVELEFAPTDFIQVNGAVNAALVAARGGAAGARCALARCSICSAAWATSPSRWRAARRVRWASRARPHSSSARATTRVATASPTPSSIVADLATPPERDGLPGCARPYTHVLLDPPRTGARAVLAAVAALAPQRVLYISCHPGSLARDLGVLVHEHGFALAGGGCGRHVSAHHARGIAGAADGRPRVDARRAAP